MVYITGDTHGDLERFKTKEVKRLRRGDSLIVCGDFGFLWNGSKEEEKVLRWLGKRRYNLLFLEGTHDNLELLSRYPTSPWNGGQVRQISGNLRQLVRGHIFQLEGDSFFAMGGGESSDLDTRVEGESWWREEMPTQEELQDARRRLEEAGNVVDFIITHECSASMRNFMEMDDLRIHPLGAFLTEVEKSCRFKRWFFGACHRDKVIPPRHVATFQSVLPLRPKT